MHILPPLLLCSLACAHLCRAALTFSCVRAWRCSQALLESLEGRCLGRTALDHLRASPAYAGFNRRCAAALPTAAILRAARRQRMRLSLVLPSGLHVNCVESRPCQGSRRCHRSSAGGGSVHTACP